MTHLATLKERSAQTLSKLQHASATEEISKGTTKRKRFQTALRGVGYNALADRILNCSRRRKCLSTYCPMCRTKLANDLNRRTSGYLSRPHAEVRHVSGYVALVPLNVDLIRGAIQTARTIFKKVARDRLAFWIVGAFELELIQLDHLEAMGDKFHPVKKEQLLGLLDDGLTGALLQNEKVAVLVHWHALAAGLDSRGRSGKAKTPHDILKSEYALHHRQLYVQRLWDLAKRPRADSLAKISSYPFKDAYRYKYTFEGSDYKNGEYIDLPTLGRFIYAYRQVGGTNNRGVLISIKGEKVHRLNALTGGVTGLGDISGDYAIDSTL